MTTSNTSYTYRVRDGQFDAALGLLKDMKQSLEKFNPKSVRAYYASAAGEASGTIVLSIEHDSAEAAGRAADASWEDAAVRELSARASAADSPLEVVFSGVYSEISLA